MSFSPQLEKSRDFCSLSWPCSTSDAATCFRSSVGLRQYFSFLCGRARSVPPVSGWLHLRCSVKYRLNTSARSAFYFGHDHPALDCVLSRAVCACIAQGRTAEVVFLFIVRGVTVGFFQALFVYTAEIFPASVRGTAIGAWCVQTCMLASPHAWQISHA
jgi:hypothetical protein